MGDRLTFEIKIQDWNFPLKKKVGHKEKQKAKSYIVITYYIVYDQKNFSTNDWKKNGIYIYFF